MSDVDRAAALLWQTYEKQRKLKALFVEVLTRLADVQFTFRENLIIEELKVAFLKSLVCNALLDEFEKLELLLSKTVFLLVEAIFHVLNIMLVNL